MTTEIVTTEQGGMIMSPTQAMGELKRLKEFVASVMIEGTDYGIIPGTGKKPTLLKPGAEKLLEIYGYAPTVEVIDKTEDWKAQPPFFHYQVKVTLLNKRTGGTVAEGLGSCNSLEIKYKYRTEWWNSGGTPPEGQGWTKAKTGWCRKTPNEETAELSNTILKMAKKRAFVDATLSATRSSELFTQDIEDLASLSEDVIEGEVVTTKKPPKQSNEPSVPCEWPECDKTIKGYKSKAGKVYTTEDVVKFSRKDCDGHAYCYDHCCAYKEGARPGKVDASDNAKPDYGSESDVD